MRDINRIDKFCNELAEIWKTNCPDWRFGQFIGNVLSDYDVSTFYMEDDEMIQRFRDFFEKAKNGDENDK